MSTWTKIRDSLESIAAEVLNYYYPGSILITQHLTSQGSQEQLNSTWGQLASLGTGMGGAYNGNLANYGSTWDSATSALGFEASGAGGAAGAGTSVDLLGGGTFSSGPEAWLGSTGAQGLGYAGASMSAPSAATPFVDSTGSMWSQSGGYLGSVDQPIGMAGAAQGQMQGLTQQELLRRQMMQQGGNRLGWGSPANLLQLGSGVMGMSAAKQQQDLAMQQQQARSPALAALNQQFQPGNLLQMPTAQNITKMPGYQAGLEAVQRQMSAQGYQGSGNMMAALSNYGGQAYQNAMNNYNTQQQNLLNAASPSVLQAQGGVYGAGTAQLGNSLAAFGQAAYGASQPQQQYNPLYTGGM